MSFFVYILKLADKSLYTGYTKNIDQRLDQHSKGRGSKYVRARLPLELVYLENYETRSEAMRREYTIKKFTRIKKLQLISNSP